MKDLSITQEFLLCALDGKGRFSAFDYEKPVCLIAGGLLELLNNEFVEIENKKVVVIKELEEPLKYLYPLFNFIKNSKPKTLKSIASEYVMSFTSRKLNELILSVGNSLVLDDCADEVYRKSFFGRQKKYIVPKKEKIDHVIQKIRAELLEDGDISEETVGLVSLLNKCHLLKRYFSKYESDQLNIRLKEIKNSSPNKMIKEMLDYIDAMMAAIIVSTTSSR